MQRTHFLLGLLLMGLTMSSQAQHIEGTWLVAGKSESGESFTHTFVADAEGYTVDFGSDGNIDIEGRYELADGIITI